MLSKDKEGYHKDFLEMLYKVVSIDNIDKESLSNEIEEAAMNMKKDVTSFL